MTKKPDLETVRAFETLETLMDNGARIVAGYYKDLIAAGLPSEVAIQIVRDWHRIFWQAQLERTHESEE